MKPKKQEIENISEGDIVQFNFEKNIVTGTVTDISDLKTVRCDCTLGVSKTNEAIRAVIQ